MSRAPDPAIVNAGPGDAGIAAASDLARHLATLGEPLDPRWRVQVYDPGQPADVAALHRLLAESAGAPVAVRDTLPSQIRDLLRAQRGGQAPTDREVDHWLSEQAPAGVDQWGRWVWQPWRRRLVRTLPPHLHRALRLDRNRLKITASEQARLGQLRVAVAGLSVGQAIVVCMAQEGVGGTFHLADLDRLDLSNLNRLRAGVGDLGLPKLTLAGRALAGIDPFLHVVGFPDGVQRQALDAFLCTEDGRPVDLLVEECDDLQLKVLLRQRARALGIPVVMATAEGGLVDLERFDLEPARPLLHGLVEHVDLAALAAGDEAARAAFVMAALGLPVLSPRTAASMLEMGQTVASWPQLASSVALGAAMVTEVARRIGLGQGVVSGRGAVALDTLLSGSASEGGGDPAVAASAGSGADAAQGPAPTPPVAVEVVDPRDAPTPATLRTLGQAAAQARRAASPGERGGALVGAPGDALRQALLDVAVLAPSGGNAQPWRLTWRGDALQISDHRARAVPAMDPDRSSVRMAAGSVAELVALAAPAAGLAAELIAPAADATTWAAEVRLRPGAWAEAPLLAAARDRYTCRDVVPGQSLPEELAAAISSAAGPGVATLVTDPGTLAALGQVAGRADRLRFLLPTWRAELAQELRWSDAAARAAGDGMDVATLGLDAAGLAGLPLLLHGPALDVLASLNLGDGLVGPAVGAFTQSAAALLLRPAPTDTCPHFAVGRALVRTWLCATAAGWSLHPWASALFVGALRPEALATLPPWARTEAAGIATALGEVAAFAPPAAPLMVARLVKGTLPPGATRSLRRRCRLERG